MAQRKQIRWHIAVFLAPAVLVYTALMIVPLFGTLNLSLFNILDGQRVFVGLQNFATLLGDPRWSASFWNAGAASPPSFARSRTSCCSFVSASAFAVVIDSASSISRRLLLAIATYKKVVGASAHCSKTRGGYPASISRWLR